MPLLNLNSVSVLCLLTTLFSVSASALTNPAPLAKEPKLAASVVAVFNMKDAHYCTGTMIRKDVVLTAAHCSVLTNSAATDLKIRFGEKTYYRIGEIRNHPSYNPQVWGIGDISLLFLDRPINEARPLKFASTKQVADKKNKWVVTGTGNGGTGWGIAARLSGGSANLLAKNYMTAFPAINSAYTRDFRNPVLDTQALYDSFLSPPELSNQLMIAEGESTYPCNGDSGGSLLVREGGEYFIAGVLAHRVNVRDLSKTHDVACSPDNAHGYTSVLKVRGWLERLGEPQLR